MKRRVFVRMGLVLLALSLYPLMVLFYTWGCVFRSDLEGGRHGPLDAYRHALASAVVAYTLDEQAVSFVSRVMESKGRDSNRMDRHNNRIGARIGAAATSFGELEPMVRRLVGDGMVNAPEPGRITWLPREKWRNIRVW